MNSLLEAKAACADLAAARAGLLRARARSVGTFRQVDTYLRVDAGRLKLRRTWPCPRQAGRGPDGTLVAYARSGSRCHYALTAVADPDAWRAGLATVLGVLVEVAKTRQVWRLGLTEVHLDTVDGLGTFVELETPLGDPPGVAQHSHRACAEVLGVDGDAGAEPSYADLVARARPGAPGGPAAAASGLA